MHVCAAAARREHGARAAMSMDDKKRVKAIKDIIIT